MITKAFKLRTPCHRDDGILIPESAITGQEGNFRALLAFRVKSGDTVLKNHLSTSSKKLLTFKKQLKLVDPGVWCTDY